MTYPFLIKHAIISQINEEMVTALSLGVYSLDGDGRTCEIMTQSNVSKY